MTVEEIEHGARAVLAGFWVRRSLTTGPLAKQIEAAYRERMCQLVHTSNAGLRRLHELMTAADELEADLRQPVRFSD